jgi:hypothetical protein
MDQSPYQPSTDVPKAILVALSVLFVGLFVSCAGSIEIRERVIDATLEEMRRAGRDMADEDDIHGETGAAAQIGILVFASATVFTFVAAMALGLLILKRSRPRDFGPIPQTPARPASG